jgi:acetolactate synthase-1/3 small subunit
MGETVVRDLALIKVKCDAVTRPQILQLCEVFRARAVDVGPSAVTLEITGTMDKVDGLVEVLRPYGVLEMVRTGAIAMSRGAEPKTAAFAA